jgi:signal transduction histidine kinase
MRNLYIKIFLWFWLAMALVGVAFVVSTMTLQSTEAESRWRAFVVSGLTLSGQSAIDAYREHGQDGLARYLERMERGRRGIRAYLYDAGLNELSGRSVPEGAADLVEAAAATDELTVEQLAGSRLVALRLTTAEGDPFVLLADIEWPFPRSERSRDRFDTAGRRDVGAIPETDSEPGGAPGVDRPTDRTPARGGGSDPRRGGRGDPTPWFGVWLSAIDQPGSLALRMGAILLTAGLLCYGLARYLTAPVLRLRDATRRLAGGDLSVRVGPAVGNRRDELAELGRDFDRMAERIESLLTTQRQLLSDVSHELRSPLARLNVALALARQRSGPQAEAPLDRIEVEAEQLNSLVGRILELVRLESGAVQPELSDVEVGRLVADIAADAGFEADPRGVSVIVRASESCRVRGNASLLRSAIENVVRNAVRYSACGTAVEIDVSRSEAGGEPTDSPAPGEVVIAVRDRGPGVPEERLDELFEPFYRLADARDRQSGGTGLGLSITDRAVRLHGGTVSASNVSDGGLLVEIRLPVA